MGLGNMIGLGFSFGYKDKGFDKGVSGAKKGLIDLKAAFSGVQDIASGVGKALGGALRLPSISPAVNAIQGIAGDMKVTTTGIEAFGVAADKVTSKTFAGINITGAELAKAKKKVASTAYGMNMSVDRVAESFAALVRAGTSAEALGFKNFKQFMGWADVLDVDTTALAGTIATLKNQFGMTDDAVGKLLERSTQLGKRFNMGGEAINTMVQQTASLSKEASVLWSTFSPETTKAHLEGVELLGAAFTDMFGSTEGLKWSQKVGTAMVSSQKDMSKLYSGLEGDLTPLLKTLAEHGNDIGDSWKLAKQDPMKFALAMAKTVKALRETNKRLGVPMAATEEQLSRFGLQMEGVLGPEFTAMILSGNNKLVNSLEKVDAGAAKLGDPTGSMAKAAGQYRSGLTAAELFARAQDQFRTSLKHVSKQLMTDSGFIDSYRKSTKLMLKQIGPMADDKGPLGKATRMLINFSYFGIGGVISKLHPLGPALFSMIQQFGPIIQMMPGLVAAFTALASPITIVAGAIGILAMYTKDSTGQFRKVVDDIVKKIPAGISKVISAFKSLYPQVKEIVVGMAGKIAEWLKGLPWGEIGKTVGDLFLGALGVLVTLAKPIANVLIQVLKGAFAALKGVDWGAVGDVLLDVGKTLFSWLGKGLAEAAKGFQWLTEAFRNIDWDPVMAFIGKMALGLFAVMLKVGWEVLKALPDIVVGIMKAAWAAITGLWNATMNAIESKLGPWAGLVKSIFVAVTIAAGLMFASLAAGFIATKLTALASMTAMGAGATVAWLKILGPISLVAAAVYGVVKAVQWLKDKVGQAGVVFAGVAIGVAASWGKFQTVFSNIMEGSLLKLKKLAGGATVASVTAKNAMTKVAGNVNEFVMDGISLTGQATDKAASSMVTAGAKGGGAFKTLLGAINPVGLAITALSVGASLVIANWGKITDAVERIWGKTKSAVSRDLDSVTKSLDGIGSHAVDVARKTRDAIEQIGKMDITGQQKRLEEGFAGFSRIQEARDKAAAKVASLESQGGQTAQLLLIGAKQQLAEADKALATANENYEKELGASGGLLVRSLGDAIKMTSRDFGQASEADIGWLKEKNEVVKKSAAQQLLLAEQGLASGKLDQAQYVEARENVWKYIGAQEAELTKLEQKSKWYEKFGNSAAWVMKYQAEATDIELQRMRRSYGSYLNVLEGDAKTNAETLLGIEQKKFSDELSALYTRQSTEKMSEELFLGEMDKLRKKYQKSAVANPFTGMLQQAAGATDTLGFLQDKVFALQEAMRNKELTAADLAAKAQEEAEKVAAGNRLEEQKKHLGKSQQKVVEHVKAVNEVVASIDPDTQDMFKRLLGIDVKTFTNKTTALKAAYVNFVKQLEAESGTMMMNTRTNFVKFLAEQEVFWKKVYDAMKTIFVDPSTGMLKGFWDTLISQIRLKGQEAVAALAQMYIEMGLATPAPETAGAQGGTARSAAQPPDTSRAHETLLGVINRPVWFGLYQSDYKKSHAELLAHLDRLIVVTGTKDARDKARIVEASEKTIGDKNLGADEHAMPA